MKFWNQASGVSYSDSARKSVQEDQIFVENGRFRSGFEEPNRYAAAAGPRATEEPHQYTARVYGLAGIKQIPHIYIYIYTHTYIYIYICEREYSSRRPHFHASKQSGSLHRADHQIAEHSPKKITASEITPVAFLQALTGKKLSLPMVKHRYPCPNETKHVTQQDNSI